MSSVKLSIIMPLFNVEKTIHLALDSILMQEVDFNYEIITVDDCSEDNTLAILKEYSLKHPNIKIIKHEVNQGNAISFYDGLCSSNGDYFCVLDGDDYYTVKNKLQKQVDFLNNDKKETYVAVAHKYLRVNNEGKIWQDNQLTLKEREHDYKDFLKQSFYYHTSTYMYRNIFRGNVPEIFKEELMRGDNPRTFMHVSYTKGKVKFLDFVGSVYRYSSNGIWSKTTPEAQHARNIRMYEFLGEMLDTQEEKNIWFKTCKDRRTCKVKQIDEKKWLDKKELIENKFMFDKPNEPESLDSLCESLAFVTTSKERKGQINTAVKKLNYFKKTYLKIYNTQRVKIKLKNITKEIFSITETQNNKHKIINILGIKIKIKQQKGSI